MNRAKFESIIDHDLEGTVFMIPSPFGGRQNAVHSGYRGQFFWHINHVDGTDWLAYSYFEGDALEPGQSGRVKIKLIGAILDHAKAFGMPTGRQFCLREGARVVAVGVITKSLYEKPV